MNLWGPRTETSEETGPDAVAPHAETDRSRQARATHAVVDEACAIVMVLAPCPRGPARNLLVDMARECDSEVPDVAAALVGTWEGEPLSRPMQRGLRHALRRLYAEDRGDGSPPVDEPSGRSTP